jgi:LCP family protein required for cell wall assembly
MKKKKIKRKRNVKPFIIILVVLAIIGLVVYLFCNKVFSRMASSDIPADEVYMYDPVNVLVLGVDAGNLEDKTGNSPKRSDTMMLIRYIPQTREVYMLSIPRDTRIYFNGKYMKINAVNAIGGPEKAISTIEEMLNVDINYYVSIDYEGFRECIDAIGGVDITIDRDMNYDAQDISIHFKAGETVHLNGELAEQYVRWRKNNDGTGYAMGDLGRIQTQQGFLLTIADKLKSPSTILRLPEVINTASKYVETNMSPSKMVKYFSKLKGIAKEDIHNETLAGTPEYIGGISYYLWDKEDSKEYLSNFRGNKDKKDEDKVEVDRSKVNVTVLNSTSVKGLAKTYKEKLTALGYNVVKVDNYSGELSVTQINTDGTKGYGETVLGDLGFGAVTENSKVQEGSNVVIILGRDSVK